jgi:hypothetical protein
MPSSTSSSETRAQERKTIRSIGVLLVGIVLIGLASEVATAFGVHRVSKIMGRTLEEYRDSQTLQSYSAAAKPTMLLFGNSLLLEGVDYPALKNALSEEYDVHRLVFEQTEYLDQYYVLRRLFRHGVRPHDVVFCTSVQHLIGNDTRGEFMAQYMDPIDIASLGRRRHMDATTISSLMFAHWSGWFAYRAETRKVVLGHVMPDVRDLATTLGSRPASRISPDEVRVKAAPRLRELKALCDQYGSRLTILVPPSLAQDHAEILTFLGEDAGIRVLIPEQPGAMNASFFRDGFHLTPAGAAIFTAKLQSELADPAP